MIDDNLEKELSHLVECDFAIGCASGNDALLLTLMVAVEHIQHGLAHVIANGRELSAEIKKRKLRRTSRCWRNRLLLGYVNRSS